MYALVIVHLYLLFSACVLLDIIYLNPMYGFVNAM